METTETYPFIPVAKRIERVTTSRSMWPRLYGTTQVIRMLGVTAGQLRWWLESGLVVPDYAGTGSGNRHAFTVTNLLQIVLVNHMFNSGVGAEKVKEVLDGLQHSGYFRQVCRQDGDIPIALLIRDHQDVETKYAIDMNEVLNGHRAVTLLNLNRMVEWVNRAVRETAND